MKSMCQDARRNSPSVAVLQADVLLQLHDVADRLVLDGAQLGVVELAGRVVGARLEQPRRAQQAADVVGPERRGVTHAHTGAIPRQCGSVIRCTGERQLRLGGESG